MKARAKKVWSKSEELFRKHERKFMSASFVFGFLWDNLTLTRIDLWLDNLILFSYLTIAGLGIAFSNLGSGKSHESIVGRISMWSPLIMQFAFGGLFSSFIVFYSRSASLIASWPFLFFLAVMFVGNEFFQKRYQRFGFQISVFFIAIFSFSIFYVPLVVNRIGSGVFLVSGVVSLLLIGLVLSIFGKIMPYRVRSSRRMLRTSIPTLYVLINIMYFTNLIPPLPLSLKDIGVYHNVERMEDGVYRVQSETTRWFDFLKSSEVYHHMSGERVYVYSAVFAPTDLRTKILHRWQFYNVSLGEWQTADTLQFPIFGGRDGGYRGYSLKSNIDEGFWRVDVITEREQLLGRVKFEVVGDGSAKLVTEIL